ncbi:MAG: hypothetical protein JXB17_13930 [Bacteroidales bacterium]|nr:hypothetical protein [Bacteroidales bacterium]
MLKRVLVKHTYKGEVVDLDFINTHKSLFTNQPSRQDLIEHIDNLDKKTDRDKISILYINENGKFFEEVNTEVKFGL